MESFDKTDVDYKNYIFRERGEDEIFPWDFIDIGVTKNYLLKEWNNAKEGIVTKNCRDKCSGCGAFTYKCGICPGVHNG